MKETKTAKWEENIRDAPWYMVTDLDFQRRLTIPRRFTDSQNLAPCSSHTFIKVTPKFLELKLKLILGRLRDLVWTSTVFFGGGGMHLEKN